MTLFQAFGVEIEYMIVDRDTLDVRPIADEVFRRATGAHAGGEFERAGMAWGNELAAHVVELRTSEPAPTLEGLERRYQREVEEFNRLLEPLNACLLPSGAHPWMDPRTQTRLWPHDDEGLYSTFDRIFDCRGHGWSNLQATHLNLPFEGDHQFVALHEAIRFLLPIMPALAASSPILDGAPDTHLDARMRVYAGNCARIPSVTARVIPEPVASIEDYHARILRPMYRDIAPLDPDRILQEEWLNARGAIARFDRSTIEVRILDSQECPAADMAIARLISAALRGLVQGDFGAAHRDWSVDRLETIYRSCIRDADHAAIDDADYLAVLRLPARSTPADAWRRLAEWSGIDEPAIRVILERGCLARRILTALSGDFRREHLREVYGQLRRRLDQSRMFVP